MNLAIFLPGSIRRDVAEKIREALAFFRAAWAYPGAGEDQETGAGFGDCGWEDCSSV